MEHVRAMIRLETNREVMDFVQTVNRDGTIDKYFLENFDGSLRVDARSYLGVLYASAEFGADGLYLVNGTTGAQIPCAFDKFRV